RPRSRTGRRWRWRSASRPSITSAWACSSTNARRWRRSGPCTSASSRRCRRNSSARSGTGPSRRRSAPWSAPGATCRRRVERGPKRRTNVFVEGRAEPIVASRTEQSILEDMGATEGGFQVQALREAITELLAAFHEFSPVLRRALLNEHHFDVEKWEQRLGE